MTHHCIRAVTPAGAPTAMEIRLRLGRHELKGDMLVVEYRRMEVEDAAWKGLQVGRSRCCPPPHTMPFKSRNKGSNHGSNRVSMTSRAICARS